MENLKPKELSLKFYLNIIIVSFLFEFIFNLLVKNLGLPLGFLSISLFLPSIYFHYKYKKIPKDVNHSDIMLFGFVYLQGKTIFNQKPGWLYLTKSHLIFLLQKPVNNEDSFKISLEDLNQVQVLSSNGSTEDLIKIMTCNKLSSRFRVAMPSTWANAIEDQKIKIRTSLKVS